MAALAEGAGAVGRIFPGAGPMAPKLGPSLSPAVPVLLQ